MKLSALRANVRRQTETLVDELPDSTIDWYLQQAFDRQLAYENQWPFFEKSWDLVLPANSVTIAVPSDVNRSGIESLREMSSGISLHMIDHAQADDWFGASVTARTTPTCYSLWSNQFSLWPAATSTVDMDYRLRGHRKPTNWIALGPDGSPDCDERLHAPMIHYAIALAYAQQEDETLESTYMQRWDMDFAQARNAIMEPIHNRPMSLGMHFSTGIGHKTRAPAYIFQPPGGP